MADPLSISANITAILQLSSTIVQYVSQARTANKERGKLLAELASASAILELLKDLAEQAQWEEAWTLTIVSLAAPRGPLNQFKQALEHLASKIKPATGIRETVNALSWPFERGEIKDILSSIERQKSLFGIALQNDHM